MNREDIPECQGCRYELTGLPDVGHCPECGQAYNLRTGAGVWQPMSDQQRLDWWLQRGRTIVLGGLAGLCLVTGLVFYLLGNSKPMGWATLFFVVLAMAAAVSYVNEDARPG